MAIDNLLPLYKVLCITIILLVPLMPAWLLYKIAPQDKILAKGNFKGFKINATGAIAIFIVLFAAISSNINDVARSIDKIADNDKRITKLSEQVRELQKSKPWLLTFQIHLTDGDGNDASDSVYRKCLDPYAVHALPMPLDISTSRRSISFYSDDNALKSFDSTCSISFPGEYGTQSLPIRGSAMNNETKSILLNAKFIKNSNTGYKPDSITSNVGSATPPQPNK